MIFETYIPPPPLGIFVECLIYHESYDPLHHCERFLPDGNVELIIDLNDAPQYIYDNDTLKEIQTCHNVWASGVRTAPITIPAGRDSAMAIVAFKRGMAYPFFPFPMDEISDCVVDADLIWGSGFAELREQVLANRRTREKFTVIEHFLVTNFLDRMTLNPCVEYAVSEMIATPHGTTVARLTDRIGYSQKHFISMFRRQVGVTPKQYLKLMRFQRVVNAIETEQVCDWSELSLDCGFFDQSHFINDFRSLSGFTPEDYARRRGGFLNYVPMERPSDR